MKKVKIVKFNVDWLFIKEACMATIGKEAGKEPTKEWKRKLLLCQHSPIRRGVVSWKWEDIPFYSMGHFVRHHVGCTPFVSTSREDRTNVPRSERKQTDSVSMEMDANIQSLIDISRKRLCTSADATTRKYWKAVLEAIKEYDEDIYWACVPECIYRGGCPEYKGCGFYEAFMKDATEEQKTNVTARYDYYNSRRR